MMMRMRGRTWALALPIAAWLFASGCSREQASDATAEPVVKTTLGAIRGTVEDGLYVFRGVQFGAPTGGERRFKPPVAAPAWSDVRDATKDALLCPQAPNPLDSLQATGFRPRSEVSAKDVSEDCLYLKVITGTLDRNAKRPVMVWIHGGGFTYGSGMEPVSHGAKLVKQGDIVHVALNHRINLFGYLYLEHLLGAEYAGSGNAGLLDIVLGLQWIKDNIERFGGDPDNVTLFGQSGGGAKISALMAMPAAQGLYHKVIIQSGSAYSKQRTVQEAQGDTRQALAHLGLTAEQAQALITMPMDELRVAFPKMRMNTRPVVDGSTLPRHPWFPDAPEISANVPMIIGVTETEGTKFAHPGDFELDEKGLVERLRLQLGDQTQAVVAGYRKLYPDYSPSDLYFLIHADARDLRWMIEQTMARLQQEGAPAYVYQFKWRTPVEGGKWRSPHGVEIPFVFNNLSVTPSMVGTEIEAIQPLADRMSQMWLAFARSGDPNVAGQPRWNSFSADTRNVMLFDVDSRQENGVFDERLALLAKVPRVEPTSAMILVQDRDAAKK
jgi:para-nitrobenzyl esterase